MPSVRTKPSVTSIVVFGFVLVAAYFLSLGPLYALILAGHVRPSMIPFLEEAYRPLHWMIYNVDWIGSFQQWWAELWISMIVNT